MTKTELQQQLLQKHQAFTEYIAALDDTDFTYTPGDKWTAGQQLDHIRLSVSPLSMAFGLPKVVPALLFGKAKTPSGSYAQVVARYQTILAQGGKAGKGYLPKPVAAGRQQALKIQMDATLARLLHKLRRFTETDLDSLRLPHPLLGKITMREMLYFTLYHVQHHHAQARKTLESR